MGVHLRCPDYDRDINRLKTEPIIINDLDPSDWQGIDIVKEYMVTESIDDTIEILPTCNCGHVRGRYNAATRNAAGVICPKCHTEVMSPIERGFNSDVWLQKPDGIVALMRINFIRMFRKAFKLSGVSILDWLCDPQLNFGKNYNTKVQEFLALNLPRGYNNFIENFDELFEILVSCRPLRQTGSGINRKRLIKFVQKNRKKLFPNYIPLPSRRSIITEQSDNNTFVVNDYGKVIEAVRDFVRIKERGEAMPVRRREKVTYNALVYFAKYTMFVDSKILSRKPGWYRKQIFGSRSGHSYRGVITGHNGETDSMKLPWRIAIGVYKPMVMGELIRQGSGQTEAESIITNAMIRWCPRVRAIFDKLIRNSYAKTAMGTPGLPQLFGRNPTLDVRSIQALVATEIKDDLNDNTISICFDILNSYNADFDGKPTELPSLNSSNCGKGYFKSVYYQPYHEREYEANSNVFGKVKRYTETNPQRRPYGHMTTGCVQRLSKSRITKRKEVSSVEESRVGKVL